MIKRKITETTEKYDIDGNLIEKITRVEEETDDETRAYQPSYHPWITTTTGCTSLSNGETLDNTTCKTE